MKCWSTCGISSWPFPKLNGPTEKNIVSTSETRVEFKRLKSVGVLGTEARDIQIGIRDEIFYARGRGTFISSHSHQVQ
jgi:hypothetical protein